MIVYRICGGRHHRTSTAANMAVADAVDFPQPPCPPQPELFCRTCHQCVAQGSVECGLPPTAHACLRKLQFCEAFQ